MKKKENSNNFTCAEHYANQQRNSNNPTSTTNNQNSKDFNWTPWIIAGLVLVVIVIVAWLFIRNKNTVLSKKDK